MNEEGHFSWSDYSIAKFTPFCTKPAENAFDKDCVLFVSNSVSPDDHANKAGCIQDAVCSMNLPYVCKIRDPDSDAHSVLFKEYLVHLLKDVVAAEGVCGKQCGNGLGSIFGGGHKRPTIGRKPIRVVRKKKRGGKRKVVRKVKKGGRSKHTVKPKDKVAASSAHTLLRSLGLKH